MSKPKSVFVTAIVAVMLGIIVFAAYNLLFPAFVVIVGGLSGVGFGAIAVVFCRWLCQPCRKPKRRAELPPTLRAETPAVLDAAVNERDAANTDIANAKATEEETNYDYESIREEVRAEDG